LYALPETAAKRAGEQRPLAGTEKRKVLVCKGDREVDTLRVTVAAHVDEDLPRDGQCPAGLFRNGRVETKSVRSVSALRTDSSPTTSKRPRNAADSSPASPASSMLRTRSQMPFWLT
jgi:hypothetical protein